MKASHTLKLKALNQKVRFVFMGNQRGVDIGEVYPLYNLYLTDHELNGSTITARTIHGRGFKKLLDLKEVRL